MQIKIYVLNAGNQWGGWYGSKQILIIKEIRINELKLVRGREWGWGGRWRGGGGGGGGGSKR